MKGVFQLKHWQAGGLKASCLVALLALASCCAFDPTPSVVVSPVGPAIKVAPETPPPTNDGYLQVSTAMRNYPMDRMMYRVHSPYGVYAPDGRRVKSVQNADSIFSPDAQVVVLPAGRYDVHAWADRFILVDVPVVIRPDRLTFVNLEGGCDAELAGNTHIKPGELVRLPDGRVIGWSATASATQ